jgi:hypothetical protein
MERSDEYHKSRARTGCDLQGEVSTSRNECEPMFFLKRISVLRWPLHAVDYEQLQQVLYWNPICAPVALKSAVKIEGRSEDDNGSAAVFSSVLHCNLISYSLFRFVLYDIRMGHHLRWSHHIYRTGFLCKSHVMNRWSRSCAGVNRHGVNPSAYQEK